MSFAYFDCASGIAGDMLLGALIDLGVPVDFLNEQIQSLLPNVRIEAEEVKREGIRAVHAVVHIPHEHHARHLSDITALIDGSRLSEKNKKQAKALFRILAEAESKVHAVGIEEVHFHEVGAADSIADIVGCVAGLDKLGITEIYSSPVPAGTGTVKIAHGTVTVPAPATAELLNGMPIAVSFIPFELTTPTGAALLKYYVRKFSPLPEMEISKTGIGAGTRELPNQANVLRVLTGFLLDNNQENFEVDHQYQDLLNEQTPKQPPSKETVWVLETNIDDMSGELIGHVLERLWTLEPLDVWTTPITMKKQRPAVMLSVMCRAEKIEAIENFLFTETSTLGIRRYSVERTVLYRNVVCRKTPWGNIEVKRAVLPDGVEKSSPEFESLKKIAEERGISVRELLQRIGN